MAALKDRVLIVGATGFLGRRLVKASIGLGHPTFVLHRPEIAANPDKVQILVALKMKGAKLLQGSLDDHQSLILALKQVDVVISTISGNDIIQQLKLVEAIKEVGTIKRFLPSEFGFDVDRMEHAIPPGDQPFVDKREIRRATERAAIPYTYVSANCINTYFLAGLAQIARFMPSTDHVYIYGSGDHKCIWVDEDDVAFYVLMTVDDPRTLNKTVYLRPPQNILSQKEVIAIWEGLIGKQLEKTFLSDQELLGMMNRYGIVDQMGIAHVYQIFCKGDLEFKVEGPDKVDSNVLYPDYNYLRAEDYLRRFA